MVRSVDPRAMRENRGPEGSLPATAGMLPPRKRPPGRPRRAARSEGVYLSTAGQTWGKRRSAKDRILIPAANGNLPAAGLSVRGRWGPLGDVKGAGRGRAKPLDFSPCRTCFLYVLAACYASS